MYGTVLGYKCYSKVTQFWQTLGQDNSSYLRKHPIRTVCEGNETRTKWETKKSEPTRFKMKTKTDNTSKRFRNINLRTEPMFLLQLQGLEERIFFLRFLSIEQSIFCSLNSSSSKNWSKITDYGSIRVSLNFCPNNGKYLLPALKR